MNELAQRLMTDKEARECVVRINTSIKNIRTLVLELYEREGWSAMGYASWRECVVKEFSHCERYLYKQLEAAQTEKNICPNGQKEIPESQLRPLTKLKDDPAQQRIAWQRAVDTAPEGKVTASHINKIVIEMMPEKPKPSVPPTPKEVVSTAFKTAFDHMMDALSSARALNWEETSHKSAIDMMQMLLNVSQ